MRFQRRRRAAPSALRLKDRRHRTTSWRPASRTVACALGASAAAVVVAGIASTPAARAAAIIAQTDPFARLLPLFGTPFARETPLCPSEPGCLPEADLTSQTARPVELAVPAAAPSGLTNAAGTAPSTPPALDGPAAIDKSRLEIDGGFGSTGGAGGIEPLATLKASTGGSAAPSENQPPADPGGQRAPDPDPGDGAPLPYSS
jgi:hypothetical protein